MPIFKQASFSSLKAVKATIGIALPNLPLLISSIRILAAYIMIIE
jgi:hypothetical protein